MRSRLPESTQSVDEIKADIPRIQIKVLGRFQVIRGETLITKKEWSAAKKPQLLLKALITRGAENVLIDLLIDDLWTDTTLDDGKQNFRVVLHRLRKILGHLEKTGSPYISFDWNMVSLNRSLVLLDIDEFLSLCKRAKKAEQAGDIKGSIGFGNAAIELYKGDYLEDELYTPWTMPKREETRAIYIDILRRTASHCERQGNSRKSIDLYKLLIKADPALEEAYRKLMLLYSNIGMRTEAIRVYNECTRVLGRELGVDPDKLTTSIYGRIVESGRPDTETRPLDFDRPRSYTPKYLADKILNNRSSIEGERKNVTVMFADVANSTAVFEDLDPEDVHQIMDGCFRLLLDEVHRFEGTINQFLGDGVMALFGAPIAHEDHVQRACHAALAIQKAHAPYAESLKTRYGIDLKLRIDLNCGPVVVGSIGNDLRMDYTAKGDTVNLAAGMENNAEPGAVMVTKHLYKLTREYFEFEPIGSIEVKAKEKSVEAYLLIKPTGVETRFAASAARGLTRFVGRAREIKALNEVFEKARSGEGRVAGISGEAGVGKSRLLLEFRNSLPKGEYRYFEGRCSHYGESMPYLPLLDVLRSFIGVKEGEPEQTIKRKLGKRILGLDKKLRKIIPPLQELLSIKVEDEEYAKLEPRQKRERTFEAIRDLLIRASRLRPMVLAIEDLHWIDRTTEEFLDYMIGFLPGTRILLLLLYRNEYTHQWGSGSCYSGIGVGQLSMSRSVDLVAAILEGGYVAPELSELILGKSAGNPFFIEELTFAMIEKGSIRRKGESFVLAGDISGMEVPDTIQGIIAARMDRLEESLKRIVQMAAVIGREFAFHILETISEMKEGLKSGLIQLQRLEFINRKSLSPELEYIFRHALTQETAYRSLLAARRKELHCKTALAIEELFSERIGEFCTVIGEHFLRGEAWERASEYLIRAGDTATRLFASPEARLHYARALDALAHLPSSENNRRSKVDTLIKQTSLSWAVDSPEQNIVRMSEAERLVQELPGPDGIPGSDLLRLARVRLWMGRIHFVSNAIPEAIAYYRQVLEVAQKLGDPELLALPSLSIGMALWFQGHFGKAEPLLRQAITAFEQLGDWVGWINAVGYLGMTLGSTGRYEEGLAQCQRAIARARELNYPNGIALGFIQMSRIYADAGNLACTLETTRQAKEAAEQSGNRIFVYFYYANRSYAELCGGQFDAAAANMANCMAVAQELGGQLFGGNVFVTHNAEIALGRGQVEQALSIAEQAAAMAEKTGHIWGEASSRQVWGRSLAAMNPPKWDEAEAQMAESLRLYELGEARLYAARMRMHWGIICRDRGNTHAAREHFEKSAAQWSASNIPWELERVNKLIADLPKP